MPVLIVKTSEGMRPVVGDKVVLEDDGLKAVYSHGWTARAREPTSTKKKGVVRRIIDFLKRNV